MFYQLLVCAILCPSLLIHPYFIVSLKFDKKIIFRLHFDEEYGVHLNYVNYKFGKRNSIKVLIPIDITEKQYNKVISGYNRQR